MSPANQRPIREVIYEMASTVSLLNDRLEHHLCKTTVRQEAKMSEHDAKLSWHDKLILPMYGAVGVIGIALAIMKLT